MTKPSNKAAGDLPLPAEQQVNAACESFELAWKEGQRPRIEDYLGDTPEPERSALLRELIALDTYYRQQAGEDPRPEEYRARFPELDLPSQASTQWYLATPSGDARPLPAIPGYEILQELGRGGMGVVYKAKQISADRVVALKVIRRDRLDSYSPQQRRQAVEQFQTEARAAARIEHDHLLPIYDVGESDGQPFYSMRYVEGPSLGDLIRTESHQRRPLEPRRVALYMEQVARAVHEAHRHGILHRDLKPQNCLLEAGSERVYVVDFGLAKLMQEGGEHVTLTGDIKGTPPYMSPEQARHSGQVTIASDVYSLGATLYALLTGQPPHQGAKSYEILRKVIEEEPVRPRKVQPAIPLDLDTICLKCLDKDPARRYAYAAQLAERLRLFLENKPIPDRPVSSRERLWRWCRRRPLIAGLIALSSLSIVSLIVTVLLYNAHLAKITEEQRHQIVQLNINMGLMYIEQGDGFMAALHFTERPCAWTKAIPRRNIVSELPWPCSTVHA
jgi:serine/threonine-protein kinase